MGVESLSVRLLFLLFPGLVVVLTIRHLTPRRKENWPLFSIYVVVMGVVSYLLLAYLSNVQVLRFLEGAEDGIQFFDYLTSQAVRVDISEVSWATLLGLGLAILLTPAIDRGWFHSVARRVRLSTRVGSADIWDFVFGARGEGAWITIRDDIAQIAYLGWVKASSDTSTEPELFLRDVTVSDYEGTELYHVPGLYLRRSSEDLTIEIEEAVVDGEHLRPRKEE